MSYGRIVLPYDMYMVTKKEMIDVTWHDNITYRRHMVGNHVIWYQILGFYGNLSFPVCLNAITEYCTSPSQKTYRLPNSPPICFTSVNVIFWRITYPTESKKSASNSGNSSSLATFDVKQLK